MKINLKDNNILQYFSDVTHYVTPSSKYKKEENGRIIKK